MCPALVTYSKEFVFNSETKGRLFELAVGTELNRLPGKLFYWRQGNFEVDYIYQDQNNLYAIEVKSGRKKQTKGLDLFCKEFPSAQPVFITSENFSKLSRDSKSFFELI